MGVDGTVLHHVAVFLGSVGSSNRNVALSFYHFAALIVEEYVVEEHVATAADIVNQTVNLAILEIELSAVVIAVVGVLIGQHGHVLANGIVTLVLQADSTSGTGRSLTRSGIVIWIVVLQRQVLQHQVLAGVQQGSCHADAFYGWPVLDDDSILTLTLDGNLVSTYLGKCSLFQVVGAVRQVDDYFITGGNAVGSIKCIKETAGITGKDGECVAFPDVVDRTGV